MEVKARSDCVRGPSPWGHRATRLQPAATGTPARDLCLRRLRPGPIPVGSEIRVRLRLAQLRRGASRKYRHKARRSRRGGAGRISLRPLSRPPGPHLSRWADRDRAASLQRWRRPQVRPGL